MSRSGIEKETELSHNAGLYLYFWGLGTWIVSPQYSVQSVIAEACKTSSMCHKLYQ